VTPIDRHAGLAFDAEEPIRSPSDASWTPGGSGLPRLLREGLLVFLVTTLVIAGWSLVRSLGLGPSGSLVGRVVDASGAPIAGAHVMVEGLESEGVTDASGTYALAGVPLGAQWIRAEIPGVGGVRLRIVLSDRRTLQVGDLVLPRTTR
jgi:hypothetical protein